MRAREEMRFAIPTLDVVRPQLTGQPPGQAVERVLRCVVWLRQEQGGCGHTPLEGRETEGGRIERESEESCMID